MSFTQVDLPKHSIEARKLSKNFSGIPAIQDISFSINRGEIVGFLGPNGAGKSTTLKILTGLLGASSGEAWVCGIPVAWNPDEVRQKIGYMPENNPLPEEMRVSEYLKFRAELKGVPWLRRKKRIDEVLEICDLKRKAKNKIIGTLSKGYKQRVGIADAIIAEPEVTILDEPTIGLDPHQIISIRKLLNTLRGKTTVILSSHILSEVEVCCDRVIILNSGHLVASGTTQELRQEFLPGSIFQLEAKGSIEKIETVIKTLNSEAEIQEDKFFDSDDDYKKYRISTSRNGKELENMIEALYSEGGIKVRTLNKVRPGLEDVFLAATRRSWTLRNKNIRAKSPNKKLIGANPRS